jgi:hypothetical protein
MSADYAVLINLPNHKRGDRWPGIGAIGPVVINGNTPPHALTRIRMHFVQKNQVYRLDSDPSTSPDAPIVIDDADTWSAHIYAVQSFLPSSGKWEWDMEFYNQGDASPLTLYKGVITVDPDVTL